MLCIISLGEYSHEMLSPLLKVRKDFLFHSDDEPNVVQIVQMLLAAGAEINCGTTTPLHTAVLANLGTSNASTDLEEFLISKGGNVFAKDEKGRLPLHYAFITKAQ